MQSADDRRTNYLNQLIENSLNPVENNETPPKKERKKGGKWNDPLVPKHNWDDLSVQDLENERMICQMCESKQIRFAHEMIHEEYEDILLCGCCCAEKMEKDPNIPKLLEKKYKKALRQQNKLKKKFEENWISSKKGNLYIIEDQIHFVMFKDYKNQISLKGTDQIDNFEITSGRKYSDVESAKSGAFMGYQWFQNRRNKKTPGGSLG